MCDSAHAEQRGEGLRHGAASALSENNRSRPTPTGGTRPPPPARSTRPPLGVSSRESCAAGSAWSFRLRARGRPSPARRCGLGIRDALAHSAVYGGFPRDSQDQFPLLKPNLSRPLSWDFSAPPAAAPPAGFEPATHGLGIRKCAGNDGAGRYPTGGFSQVSDPTTEGNGSNRIRVVPEL
jgi:hypothetical protein